MEFVQDISYDIDGNACFRTCCKECSGQDHEGRFDMEQGWKGKKGKAQACKSILVWSVEDGGTCGNNQLCHDVCVCLEDACCEDVSLWL